MFTTFTSVRAKVVQTPLAAVAGTVVVPASPVSGRTDIAAPVAVIARIHNDSDSARQFTLRLADRVVCRTAVPARSTRRVDCASRSPWDGTQSTTLSSDDAGTRWSLEYLELATHHGATQAYDLVIVPVGATGFAGVHGVALGIAACLLAMLFITPGCLPTRFHVVGLHRVASVLVATFLTLVFVSHYASSYWLLISVHAFFWYVIILAAPRIWFLYTAASERIRAAGRTSVALGAVAVLLVCACYGSVTIRRVNEAYGGNISGVLHISRTLFARDPLLNTRDDIRKTLALNEGGGYDAEFMYFQMYDPFLRAFKDHPATYRQFIDAGPYRFDRVGYPLLAKALSLDRWQLYPAAMFTLVFGSVVLCAALIAILAADMRQSPLWGLAVVVIPGFWQSVQNGLPEALAAALLIGGYLAVRRQHLVWAAVLFAASLLVRETGVFFILAVAAFGLTRLRFRDKAWFVAAAVMPMALWHVYVGMMLMADWGPGVFLYHPGDFGVPFAGIAHLWSAVAHYRYYPEAHLLNRAAIFYPMLLISGAGLAVAAAATRWSAPAAAALIYAFVALSLNFESIWIHVGNAERGTYELFVMLLIVTLQLQAGRRALRWTSAAFWVGAALYLFFLGFDAEFIRATLWI